MSDSTHKTRIETIRRELRSLLVHMKAEHFTYRDVTRMIQRITVEQALSEARDNQCRAADILGVHRNTIWRMMLEFGIAVRKSKRVRHRYTIAPPIQLSPKEQNDLKVIEREIYPPLHEVEEERDAYGS